MPYPSVNGLLDRLPTDLPIEASQAAIDEAIREGSLVLTAEPGAGKSSIVPLIAARALAAKAAEPTGTVMLLEPRRLAARATAARLSELLPACGGVGDLVGLTIRGDRRHSARTRIEVVTEAVLTSRLQRDPELPGVAAIIFDEFHERNLHSDLGLAMALESRATIRPDLAIVVMSATLETEPVAALVQTDNVLDVPGRTFPVETVHLRRPDRSGWASAVADATVRAFEENEQDTLVFVPGRREIADVSRRLEGRVGATVLGLHGGSSNTGQDAALASTGKRRIIVATAVAETSVTLPGIDAVVDGGLLRRARFDPSTGLGRLETVHVTRFSADQRRGRAGRLGPGVCYRLWSSEDHRHLEQAVPPDIVDGDPLPIAFELARWGDPDAASLPLLDHPGTERLAAGRRLLTMTGLVNDDGGLSDRGQLASRLGLHPRLGALLLTASDPTASEPTGAGMNLTRLGAVTAALLDDDRWPNSCDLGAELDRRWKELQRSADRLQRRLPSGARAGGSKTGGSKTGDSKTALTPELPALMARAWPDRIAAARGGRAGHFLLASGREVEVPTNDPLFGAEFLIVAEADGVARSARVRRAVAIDRPTLLEAAAQHIVWIDHVEWDDRDDSIRSERQQRIGSIVLHRQPFPDPSPTLVADALAVGLRRQGLRLIGWSNKALELRNRLAWLHSVDPSWPDVSDEALLANVEQWLDLSRCRTPADVRRLQAGSSLLQLLDWEQRSMFDQMAPSELPVPAGGMRTVQYASGRPVWPVRLQHLFGLDEHPLIGPTKEALTIELLSPANRPAQVTTDLPGFWRGSYAAVRTELRGRYPKHQWPENPWDSASNG